MKSTAQGTAAGKNPEPAAEDFSGLAILACTPFELDRLRIIVRDSDNHDSKKIFETARERGEAFELRRKAAARG